MVGPLGELGIATAAYADTATLRSLLNQGFEVRSTNVISADVIQRAVTRGDLPLAEPDSIPLRQPSYPRGRLFYSSDADARRAVSYPSQVLPGRILGRA